MQIFSFVLAVSLTACSTAQHTPKMPVSRDLNCAKEPGFVAGPFVTSMENAFAIANVVIDSQRKNSTNSDYDLWASDAGEYWTVGQSLNDIETEKVDDDTFVISSGGGGIAMRISKCDGAVTNVRYIR